MQLRLIAGTWSKDRFAFGGALLKKSHAKRKRYFSPRLALHVVMRSSQAKGQRSLFFKNKDIAKILDNQALRHSVKIFSAANAGNHLHLLIQAPSQNQLSNFLRAIAGRIAQLVKDSASARRERSRRDPLRNDTAGQTSVAPVPAQEKSPSFWDARPFSRIVSWGRDFQNVLRYVTMNATQSTGWARRDVKELFKKIEHALKAGILRKTPGLVASGFV